MAFKDELRTLRKQDGLTQAELARRLGISKSTISMYENGNREPDFETLEAFADYFNVDMNRLTGISKAPAILSDCVPADQITKSEYSLVRAYRMATPEDRQIIDNIVSHYAEEGKNAKTG